VFTEIFEAQLGRIELQPTEFKNLSNRGHDSLKAWLAQSGQQLKPGDYFEYDFRSEGSRIGTVRLTGVVDRLAIDEKRRTIIIVDYKTGRSYNHWQNNIVKLHLFQRQLLFYKLLIENSARFRKYKVEQGIIEFIEPDEAGKINRLELSYDDEAIKQMIKLMKAVWQSVQTLKFPDVSAYQPTLAGVRKFESDLITKDVE
jgi:hypothetical protein